MKKNFLIFIFLITIFSSSITNAQYGENKGYFCADVLYPADYQACCTDTKHYIANSVACDAYVTQKQGPKPAVNNQILNDICVNTRFNSLVDILNAVKCFLRNGVIPIIMIATVLFFLVSVLRYVSEKDSKKQDEYKKIIIWGLVGLFVMVSLWGIVEIISVVFGLGSANPIPLLQTRPY